MLPLSVPVSLLVANYFYRKFTVENIKDRFFIGTSFATSIIFWAGGIGLGIYVKFFLHERIAGFEIMFFILAFILSLAGLLLFYLTQKKKTLMILMVLLGTMYLVAFTIWQTGLPRVGTYKNVRPYARKIIELRAEGEPVVAYRKLFLGLPFYLKERVVVIGTKTESKFDTLEEKEGYFYKDPEAIKPFIKAKTPCFILTKVSDSRELNEKYGKELTELMRSPKVVLFQTKER